MNQITLYGITGRTELGLNEYIASTPSASGMFDTAYRLLAHRTYTIQAQEDSHLFHLTEQFWGEATDRYFSDVPDNEPNHEPEAYPDPWCAPDYVPCEQQAYVSEATTCLPDADLADLFAYTWTLVTTFDLTSQPTPFKSLEIGTQFYDPFTQDMARKTSDRIAIVLASGNPAYVGREYGFTDDTTPMNNTVYPVLPATAQHLAEWIPEPLATDPGQCPPADHPEGWNAPASLPPAADSPEPSNEGIPVTYKVPMGNCYRLYHHTRQVAIVPNYAQGETIAQALAATFAGRLADFSLTLDFIEGAAP